MKINASSDICLKDAVELASMIRNRDISATEVMTAFLSQIARVNPKVNAICTLVGEDSALRSAKEADDRLARGERPGPLYGLPHAVKDLVPTAGLRTTFGSRIYRDFIPDVDGLIVERLKAAGAIIIGKTNVPEFGAGSQTFNEVFGATLNPFDLTKTCGGSSGGAAVALACGMVPLADGSDLGGSLRNPAGFCNVVGFRTAPGRVPVQPRTPGSSALSVEGPMARTVQDAALLLSVLAGPYSRVRASIDEPGLVFGRPLERDFRGTRIAWSRNLGRYPVQPVVNEVCDAARSTLLELGCEVEECEPDFSDADEVFQVLRSWSYAQTRGEDLRQHRDLIKDTVVWNIEQGLKLSTVDVQRAEAKRAKLIQRMSEFMKRYEFLVLPVSQVAPFPVEVDWVKEINGVRMETYIDWMASCYAITVTELPAISVPCGFTKKLLPIGLQIVGRPRREFEVLQMAFAFEQATQYGRTRPAIIN
ncbi:MAG TPA: amidase [Blastocatellia bacterium]|nr:amidase [Blastocatellia bacterium]